MTTNKTQSRRRRALLIDDEPEHLGWLLEYIESLGMDTTIARTLDEALAEAPSYDVYIVDMNIPASSTYAPALAGADPVFVEFPGLYLAQSLRSKGAAAHKVIVFTVHDNAAAESLLERTRCRYVLKGRPNILKRVITSALGGQS